jgi:hypothetical protein
VARSKKLIETENDVKALVKKAFDSLGAWSYAPIQTGMGVHGIPDRIACVPVKITPEMVGKTLGLFAAVESKRPGRRGEKNAGATGQQVDQLDSIIDAGGVAMLCDGDVDMLRLSGGLCVVAAGHNGVWRAMLDDRLGRTNG